VRAYCDFCSEWDDQCVVLEGGWHICPTCDANELPTDNCDVCGEPVERSEIELFVQVWDERDEVVIGLRHPSCDVELRLQAGET
jgi:hypothetical protein